MALSSISEIRLHEGVSGTVLFPCCSPFIESSAGCPDLARSSSVVLLFSKTTITTHEEPRVTQSVGDVVKRRVYFDNQHWSELFQPIGIAIVKSLVAFMANFQGRLTTVSGHLHPGSNHVGTSPEPGPAAWICILHVNQLQPWPMCGCLKTRHFSAVEPRLQRKQFCLASHLVILQLSFRLHTLADVEPDTTALCRVFISVAFQVRTTSTPSKRHAPWNNWSTGPLG